MGIAFIYESTVYTSQLHNAKAFLFRIKQSVPQILNLYHHPQLSQSSCHLLRRILAHHLLPHHLCVLSTLSRSLSSLTRFRLVYPTSEPRHPCRNSLIATLLSSSS